MTQKKYLPSKNLVNPYIKNLDEYNEMYQSSINNPQAFFHRSGFRKFRMDEAIF